MCLAQGHIRVRVSRGDLVPQAIIFTQMVPTGLFIRRLLPVVHIRNLVGIMSLGGAKIVDVRLIGKLHNTMMVNVGVSALGRLVIHVPVFIIEAQGVVAEFMEDDPGPFTFRGIEDFFGIQLHPGPGLSYAAQR